MSYGPWVRHDWCPRCARQTEQTRWHRRLFERTPVQHEWQNRCNECYEEIALVAS